MLELLAGALLVGLEIRDQMRDRELDSEAVKVLAEARSLPQTVLHRTRAAATRDAETKKETASIKIYIITRKKCLAARKRDASSSPRRRWKR